ncbi:hypothetical protein RhiirA5_416765 [Rhizophagus irregularis]|uniref:Uncharacterized protein n=1 Tax=Rhizophagus irregularis TaxID=588596 RepID=A0A2I1FDA3_9GLOM|nr:hypothetical protein RhiirA5_416765 [Rhizophagus irregularis]PKC63650.1 hypothetical protein RhiirA1_463488 [Rhizophagus irregularis]PKY32370.1 hypothetical protein RhiirB3_450513 [Rhizophagus irregularis]
MDVVYLSDPAVFTDWRTISVALEKVVAELVLLTTQFISINSRIIKLESIITTPTPPSGPFNASTSFYIPASMKEWDDTIKPNSNILDISPSFAINKYFRDHQARSSSLTGPDPTFYYANGSS